MEHQQAIENLAVERYLLSEMTSAERDEFEAHYFVCLDCAADLRAAEQFLGHARELWAAEGPPGFPTASPPKRSGWSFAWLQPEFAAPAMAALLIAAFAGGISSLRLRTQLTDAAAPVIVFSTVLRTETRGAAPVIAAVPGQPVLIEFDLPDDVPNVALQFLIRSSDGTVALTLPEGTHESGERVKFLIPRIELAPGRYNLSVEASATSAGNRSAFVTYPMEIK